MATEGMQNLLNAINDLKEASKQLTEACRAAPDDGSVENQELARIVISSARVNEKVRAVFAAVSAAY